MRTITAQSVSLVASLETVWGIVFGVLLLGDILTASAFLGGTIILVPMMVTYDFCSEMDLLGIIIPTCAGYLGICSGNRQFEGLWFTSEHRV